MAAMPQGGGGGGGGSEDVENWQAQVEELVALQSIYGADCFRLLLREPPPANGGSGNGSGSGASSSGGRSDDGAFVSAHAAGADGPGAGQPADDGELLLSMLCQSRPEGAGLLRAEVLAEVNLPPGGLQLTLGTDGRGALAAGGASSSSSSSSGGSSAAARGMPVGEPVRWLPPLRASFELPAGYPSREPPCARLDAGWLRPSQLRALEAGLLEVWEAQGGADASCPVLFAFLEWLREEALGRLGIADALLICGGGGGPAAGCEAAAESVGGSGSGNGSRGEKEAPGKACSAARGHSAEQMAAQLLMFHASKEQEEFEAAQHTCGVCFESIPGSACIRLPGCRHFYCRGCLQGLCSTNVKDGSFDALRCPEPSCRKPLLPHVLRALLSAEEFARWEGLLLQRTLDRMEDLVYCPRCETPCIEDSDHFAQCDKCLFAFCSLCCSSWHPGSQCLDEEARLLIMSRRQARGGSGARNTAAEMDLVQQLASLKLLRETSRECPGCRCATDRVEGCNKMTCGYCSTLWCWRCGVAITGYDHFKAGGCRLFEQAEVDRWNAMFAGDGIAVLDDGGFGGGGGGGGGFGFGGGGAGGGAFGGVPGGGARVRVTHCPGCGQLTFQAPGNRNNLIKCWSCGRHFCHACHTMLGNRPGLHFVGAAGCKQHG